MIFFVGSWALHVLTAMMVVVRWRRRCHDYDQCEDNDEDGVLENPNETNDEWPMDQSWDFAFVFVCDTENVL